MAPNTAIASPFTSNILAGWEPVHPHIRYPVTIGLHREGENYALFLAPMNLKLLHQLLPVPETDQALVMKADRWANESTVDFSGAVERMPWKRIAEIHDDVDIIHLPAGSKLDAVDAMDAVDAEQLSPILAAPHTAVPTQWGSRLAIGFHDGCHATIVTPHAEIIQSIMIGFMAEYIQSVVGFPIHFPEIPKHLQESLLAPMLPGEWTEVRFLPHKRYWCIEFAHQGVSENASRWVAGANHGYWRSGWSW